MTHCGRIFFPFNGILIVTHEIERPRCKPQWGNRCFSGSWLICTNCSKKNSHL